MRRAGKKRPIRVTGLYFGMTKIVTKKFDVGLGVWLYPVRDGIWATQPSREITAQMLDKFRLPLREGFREKAFKDDDYYNSWPVHSRNRHFHRRYGKHC